MHGVPLAPGASPVDGPPPEQRCRWPYGLRARSDSAGYRETAEGPPGVLPPWGSRLIFSSKSISQAHVSSLPASLCRPGWGVLAADARLLEHSPRRRAPGTRPQPAVLLYEPRTAQGQPARTTGRGRSARQGPSAWRSTACPTPCTPAPPHSSVGGCHPPPPTPPDTAEPQAGPSWHTCTSAEAELEDAPPRGSQHFLLGCPGPQHSGTEPPPALPLLHAPPSITSRHHSRHPGRSLGHSVCLGPSQPG